DWADVMLPVGPFTETSGTFVNAEGRAQSFKGVAAAVGDSRPGWKVLRVMGNLLELPGFDEETSEEARDAVLTTEAMAQLSNQFDTDVASGNAATFDESKGATKETGVRLQRIGDVPIYRSDMIVRRSRPLQETTASQPPVARLSSQTFEALGLAPDAQVKCRATEGEAQFEVKLDETVPAGAIRIVGAFAQSAPLGSRYGYITVEPA